MTQWQALSPAMCLRLLPSRNQYEAQFKQMMENSEARSLTLNRLADRPHLDLFTDGSCWNPELPWASVGAWAVVSASHDVVVARGVLAGLHQTSDQAELQAISVAVEFAVCNKGTTTLWTDSAFAAEGVHRLLQNLEDCPGGRYTAYWERLQRLLHGHTHRISIQHVPAHVAIRSTYADVEDWAAGWNDRADHEASVAHTLRDHELESLRQRILCEYHDQCALLGKLVHFHLDLAASHFVASTENVVEEEDTVTVTDPGGLDGHRLALHHDPWQRGLPDASPLDWRVVQMADKFGWLFTQNMFAWLKGQALDEAVVAYQMSYLELAVHHGSGQVNTKLPVPDPNRKLCWVDPSNLPAAAVSRPTVAAILRLLQNFFVALDDSFDFGLQFVHHLDLTQLGALTPQRGVTLLISRDTVNMIGSQLAAFTQKRPIRKAGDLTRPLR
jgi:ribonuclease HI